MPIDPNLPADPSASVVQIADRCVVQVITIARFRRPENPRRCSIKRYHVWRWRGGPKAPAGTTCQCGLLKDPPGAYERLRQAERDAKLKGVPRGE